MRPTTASFTVKGAYYMSKSDLSSSEQQIFTARQADLFSAGLSSPLVMSFSKNDKVMEFK